MPLLMHILSVLVIIHKIQPKSFLLPTVCELSKSSESSIYCGAYSEIDRRRKYGISLSFFRFAVKGVRMRLSFLLSRMTIQNSLRLFSQAYTFVSI